VAALTPEERLWCLDGDAPCLAGLDFLAGGGYHRAPFHAARVERVGLPGFSFADGPRGVVIGNATAFPVPMGRGATWDPALEERVGDAIGRELRASGATLFGGVCINLLRHPGWGRAQETYGEDPHHVGEMGAALTRGVQRHAMACVKHFAANSMEDARFKVDVRVDDVALHEVYLPHFRRVVDEGVAAVMSAYNAVNGACCGENRALLTEVLRDEWGFEGFVISDWIFGLRDAARSLAAGLDVEMPYRMVRARDLPGALERGEVSWADVDRAVTRLVGTLLRFDPVLAGPPPDRAVIGSAGHRALAGVVAGRACVLLRNEPVAGEPVLPLDPGAGGGIAVVGALAATVNLGDGGSSDVWALDCVTLLDGIRSAAEDRAVAYLDGSDPAAAAAAAARADVAIVVAGTTYRDEGEYIGDPGVELGHLFPSADEPEVVARFEAEIASLPAVTVPPHVAERSEGGGFGLGGDRRCLRLHDPDVALIRAVAAANPRTVVVLQGGSAFVCSEWLDDVAAVVHAFHGGSEAGHGLADVLFGRITPSGRLPFSVPADEAHLPPFDPDADRVVYDRWHGWWRLQRDGRRPTFPFGFGLSYTTFALDGVEVAVTPSSLAVTATVRNTGDRDGADVVFVTATLPDPDAPARLIGFQRVEVPAGGSAPIAIDVPRSRLATRDPARRRFVPPRGTHTVTVGRHVGDPQATSVTVRL
jgi:beta-glucosidase